MIVGLDDRRRGGSKEPPKEMDSGKAKGGGHGSVV